MKNRITQLIRIIHQVKYEEDKCLKELGQVTQEKNYNIKRLNELKDYFNEYQDTIRQMTNTVVSSTSLLQYQRFLDNLNKVIKQQKQTCDQLEQKLQIKKSKWLQVNYKRQSLEKIMKTKQLEYDQSKDKKIQQEVQDLHILRK